MTVVALRSGIMPTDDPLEAAFNQGKLAFLRGDKRPKTPPDRLQGTTTEAFWLGYMCMKFLADRAEHERHERVRRYIELGDDL